MAKVIFGNHSSVLAPRQDRDSIRKFFCDVLGGKIMKADAEGDFIRLREDFHIGFLYGENPCVPAVGARNISSYPKSDGRGYDNGPDAVHECLRGALARS